MNIKPYIKIARPDHWVKQVFVIPGVLLAAVLTNTPFQNLVIPTIVGLISTCLIASANYTINEWLDREFDKYHPKKKNRPSVNNLVKEKFVYLEYFLLASTGLLLALIVSQAFFWVALLLLIMGVLYNVEPIRTKDKPYLDVLSESINNPIRLMLGWFIVTSSVLPPTTLIIAYWMGGAFLMAIKRYAEYVSINDLDVSILYRKSFKYYTKESLILSSFFYALCSAFFLGVFMFKYRIELILCFPFISLLFVWYMHFALSPNSPMQHPEGLYTEKKFVAFLVFLVVLVGALLVVDIPFLEILTEYTYSVTP